MSYEVNVTNELLLSKSKFLKASIIFCSIFAFVLVGDILLVTLSKENYTPFLIISIIISILFVWFAIYFFFNIYVDINNRYRYFQGYEKGMKSDDEVIFQKLDSEMKLVNGVYVYPLHVTYVTNLDQEDKVIYSFSDDLHFKRGDKLTIRTYQRILINAESHK